MATHRVIFHLTMLCSLVRGRGFLFFRKTAEVKQNNLNSFLMKNYFPREERGGLGFIEHNDVSYPEWSSL